MTNPKAIAVALAFKQSIETSQTPGLSVNAHPNAFMLNVIGTLDLYRAAEYALRRADEYDAAEAKRKEADAATAASAVDGH
jgi:hypothetical protein